MYLRARRRCGCTLFLGRGGLRFLLRVTSRYRQENEIKPYKNNVRSGANHRGVFQGWLFQKMKLRLQYSHTGTPAEVCMTPLLPFWPPCPLVRLPIVPRGRILRFQPGRKKPMKTSRTRPTHTLWLGSFLVLASAASTPVRAQSQSDQSQSVAEAARKAREQKKAAAKNNPVIDDDTINLRPVSYDTGASPPAGTVINTTPVMPSAEGASPNSPEPAKPADVRAHTATSAATSSEADARKAEEQAEEIAKTKDLLKQMQSELDLLKRQLALDSESFYSKPDYAHDSDGKSRLDELQRAIDDKMSSIDDLKQRLQALLQEAGVSADTEKAPAPGPPRP